MSDERGIALLNTTIDYGEGLALLNRYFEQMKLTLESMGVQVHPFSYKDLANPLARERIINQFAGMVVSGNDGFGPHFMKEAEFAKRYGFIVDFPTDKRALFVCRGAQFAALARGAKMNDFLAPERGPTTTEVVDKNDLLLRGMPAKFEIHADHSESIDPSSLPPSYKIVASSPNCKVSVVHINGTSHWLSQNHMEYGQLTAKQLLRNFLYAF